MKRRIPILAAAFLAVVIRPPAPAAHETVTLAQADCSRYGTHVPDPSVAYKPGVDVNGNKVTPADLDSAPRIEIPKEITIAITVELQERFGLPATKNVYKGDAHVGKVTWKDGRAWFNGKPLSSEAETRLAEACRKIAKGSP